MISRNHFCLLAICGRWASKGLVHYAEANRRSNEPGVANKRFVTPVYRYAGTSAHRKRLLVSTSSKENLSKRPVSSCPLARYHDHLLQAILRVSERYLDGPERKV